MTEILDIHIASAPNTMTTVRIAPTYRDERSWLTDVPASFEGLGEEFSHGSRNVLRRVTCGKTEYCIKRFGVPNFLRRVYYTYVSPSKAERSFEYGLRLQALGIGTPAPVALIQEKRRGLLGRSYYVCTQLSGDYREIRYCYFGPLAGNEAMLTAFAQFTARVHEASVYHFDYSPGNILLRRNDDGSYDFQLVDINRMKFCPVSVDMGCRNFARLFENDDVYRHVARAYAEARGVDVATCERLILKYQRAFDRRKRRKRALKRLVGKS